MKTMIELSMVVGDELVETGGEDDLPSTEVREVYCPAAVDVESVRDFYPRKRGKPGTRILFRNGSAMAVKESYGDVRFLLERAGITFIRSEGVQSADAPAVLATAAGIAQH